MSQLEIKDLHISIGEKSIVKGFNLTIKPGEVHAIMGPNGTGKSTLAKAIAGHPDYTITQGDVLLDGQSVLAMEPDERARAGLFLAFQYPSEIPGVSIANFLRAAVQARMAEGEELDATGYYKRLYAKMDMLKIDRKFTARAVNDGFSGGEKKRCEILQMAMLEPKIALMDETDSGLDIDALRIVAEGVNAIRAGAKPPRHPPHHALSAPARLHRAGLRPRDVCRPHREERRQDPRPRTRGQGLRLGEEGIRGRDRLKNQ
jgi:Fe-S cluster assembly ATP-binding protein